MKKWLFNPFETVAGMSALLIGLAAILLTALIAPLGQVHLDGVLDFHAGQSVSVLFAIIEGVIDWLCVALVLFLCGKMISSSSIRFIDVIGTAAMSRAPYLISTLFAIITPNQKMLSYFEFNFFGHGEKVDLSITDLILFGTGTLFMIACAVWFIILLYKAYTISCNVKGTKAIVSFIIAVLVSEVISKTLITFLFNKLN